MQGFKPYQVLHNALQIRLGADNPPAAIEALTQYLTQALLDAQVLREFIRTPQPGPAYNTHHRQLEGLLLRHGGVLWVLNVQHNAQAASIQVDLCYEDHSSPMDVADKTITFHGVTHYGIKPEGKSVDFNTDCTSLLGLDEYVARYEFVTMGGTFCIECREPPTIWERPFTSTSKE